MLITLHSVKKTLCLFKSAGDRVNHNSKLVDPHGRRQMTTGVAKKEKFASLTIRPRFANLTIQQACICCTAIPLPQCNLPEAGVGGMGIVGVD